MPEISHSKTKEKEKLRCHNKNFKCHCTSVKVATVAGSKKASLRTTTSDQSNKTELIREQTPPIRAVTAFSKHPAAQLQLQQGL